MLEIRDLKKNYGSKQALKGLNLTMSPGIYGLLGPNGAGKSTLMDILTGNKKATSGEIRFDGEEIGKAGKRYREKVGYMPQQQALYPEFTAVEFLSYIAALKGLGKREAKAQIEKALARVDLSGAARSRIGSFSGGMKQRLLIAQAILGDPKLLILDEPTAGLDPKQRIAIRNLISELAGDKIVLIATHVVSDVEMIANRIFLLKEGEMIAQASREELTGALDGRVWEVEIPAAAGTESLAEGLIGNVSRDGDRLFVRLISETEPQTGIARRVRPSLEDVYLYHFRE